MDLLDSSSSDLLLNICICIVAHRAESGVKRQRKPTETKRNFIFISGINI